ncbi:MAG: OmpA family protein, partial [Acidobacteriota bacterium]|nr:OmpA family protein [Acidobacteriota bacterium]
AGADAGEVEEIRVPRNPSEKLRLKLRVVEELRGLVRTDSVASIQTDGLVGNKFIQIEAGTDGAPQAPEGSTIAGSPLYDFTDLFAQASKTLATVNEMITDVKASVDLAFGGLTEMTEHAKQVMQLLDTEMQVLFKKGRVITTDLGLIVNDIKTGKGTAGKLVNDPEIYNRANALIAEAQSVVATVNGAAEEAKALVADMRSNNGPVHGAIADLRGTLAGAREVMADLAENSEALKRNFFFKGFFERRGYYDLDDMPVEEYRKGALESNDRRVARVWLRASVLFAVSPTGEETLTDAGKARLESAMSEFLSQPKDAPLVIEGYAAASSYDARFIASRRRATLVRDYLTSRLQLDAARIGVMPLGSEAPGSPDQGAWDGIAVAIFLKTAR